MRSLLIAAALLVAAPVSAQAPAATRAVLADAAKAPGGRIIIDGAAWRCEGSSCTATGGASQPAARACRRVVARFGQVTEFAWKGETLSAEQLAACNA
jgi:membrane protein implicated in regulation of membrane protease activity